MNDLVLFCIMGSGVSRFSPSNSCCSYCLVIICEEHMTTPEKTVGKLYGLNTLGVQKVLRLKYSSSFFIFSYFCLFFFLFCITSPACVRKSLSYSPKTDQKMTCFPFCDKIFLRVTFGNQFLITLLSVLFIFPNCIDFSKAD